MTTPANLTRDFVPGQHYILSHSATQLPPNTLEAMQDTQKLAVKIITQAARDARYRYYYNKDDRLHEDTRRNGQDAYEWFFSPNLGFKYWCAILEIRPEVVRDFATRELAEHGYVY